MSYVNKVLDKSQVEHEIQDARIPEAAVEDAGKVLKVGEDGGFELGEGGSDIKIASYADSLGNLIIYPNNMIIIPSTITNNSTMQDVIDANIGIVAPTSGTPEDYIVKFEGNVFGMGDGAVFSLLFFPYGGKRIQFTQIFTSAGLHPSSGLKQNEYLIAFNSSEFPLDTPFASYTSSHADDGCIIPPVNNAEEEGTYLFTDVIVMAGGPPRPSHSFSWVKSSIIPELPNDAASKTYAIQATNGTIGWQEASSGGTQLYEHYFTIHRSAISSYDISLTIVTTSAANIIEDTGGYNYRLNIKGRIISACGTDSVHEVLNVRKTSSNSIVISMTGNFDSEQEGYVVKLETIDGIGQFTVVSAETVTPL